jgi:C1A family cysteine protease
MKNVILYITTLLTTMLFSPASYISHFHNWYCVQKSNIKKLSTQEDYFNNYKYILKNNFKSQEWELTTNKFAGYKSELFDLHYKGYNPKSIFNRTKFVNKLYTSKFVDWRSSFIVGPIKDQGQCGSCWAFSAIGTLESQVMKLLNQSILLSEQDMIDCVKNVGLLNCCNGCEGGEMYSVYEYLLNKMDTTENQYPYLASDENCKYISSSINNVKVKDFISLSIGNEEEMVKAINNIGPLSVGVNANQDWQLYSKGIYNPSENDCSSNIDKQDHGVIVVGYGTENGLDYWIIRNSWGKDWGENGYMRLVKGKNACGVANSVIYPIVEKV